MGLPTLDESIRQLKAICGASAIDPDEPLLQSEVDSLDLIEWFYEMQELHAFVSADETIFENIDETVTFRRIHEQIIDAESAVAVASAADDA